jgi:hypothetical protein
MRAVTLVTGGRGAGAGSRDSGAPKLKRSLRGYAGEYAEELFRSACRVGSGERDGAEGDVTAVAGVHGRADTMLAADESFPPAAPLLSCSPHALPGHLRRPTATSMGSCLHAVVFMPSSLRFAREDCQHARQA